MFFVSKKKYNNTKIALEIVSKKLELREEAIAERDARIVELSERLAAAESELADFREEKQKRSENARRAANIRHHKAS